jgi:hypothetical protein
MSGASNDDVSFEQRLFLKSPLGTFATATTLFVVLAGSYALLAMLSHTVMFDYTSRDRRLTSGAFPAFVLSLLVATILGMQRYVRAKEQSDAPAFAAIASSAASATTILRPASRKIMLGASAAGATAGIALAVSTLPLALLRAHPALFAWHLAVIMFLSALFARGAAMTARGGRAFEHLIEHDLRIDLLQIDKLGVIGRRSARNALIWFTVAAIVCLFFVGNNVDLTNYIILGACAGMGLWIFFRPIVHVHRRIRAEKQIALDRIRHDIASVRDRAVDDAAAATRMQALLAYESRIQSVHEWPFDPTTLARVASYVLIPALPWIGKALLGDAMQHLAR